MKARSYELSEALSKLIHQQPFFAVLLLDLLELKETDSVPTAATDAKHLFVNPNWFNKLDIEERVFVLAHEVMHVVYGHIPRAKLYQDRGVGPDLKAWSFNRWNQAADYIINDQLAKSKVGRMPMGGLHHPNYGADDLADDVYIKVPEQKGAGKGGNTQGQGNWDVHLPPDPNSPPPAKAQVQRAVKGAAAAAKAQGKTPYAMDRLVEDICEPQINWGEQIKMALHRVAGKDAATWVRPNRRRLAVAPHVYWPGTESYQVGVIAMVEDSSGSVSADERAHYFGEMAGILTELRPQQAFVSDCSTECAPFVELNDPEELRTYVTRTGGGTHMPAIFEQLEKENIRPDALVILTDMYTDYGEPPGYPVIWVATSDKVASHGETIRIHVGQ